MIGTSINNNRFGQLIQLWKGIIEEELIKSLRDISLPKVPKINDKMGDEDDDTNNWVNAPFSFSQKRRTIAGSGDGQRWSHLLQLD